MWRKRVDFRNQCCTRKSFLKRDGFASLKRKINSAKQPMKNYTQNRLEMPSLKCSVVKLTPVLVGLGLVFSSALAFADVKVVSKVNLTVKNVSSTNVTSSPADSQRVTPQIVTTYFKGPNARTEIDDTTIVIYNGKEGKVYTLDPRQKTYFVQTFKELVDAHPDAFSGQRGTLKVAADLTLSPGDGKRSIAGVDSAVFILSGTVTASAQRSGGGSGGLGGFGGFGGGRRGGGGGGSRSRTPPKKVEVSGEYWLSDGLKLPDDKRATALPAIFWANQIQNYVFGPVSDSLLKKRDLPLDSRIAVTSTQSDGSQVTTTKTTEVTAVTQGPLADDLFLLPVGFTQVAPPNS